MFLVLGWFLLRMFLPTVLFFVTSFSAMVTVAFKLGLLPLFFVVFVVFTAFSFQKRTWCFLVIVRSTMVTGALEIAQCSFHHFFIVISGIVAAHSHNATLLVHLCH